MKKLISYFIIVITVTICSCKKQAGEGGSSTIKGTINIEEWNSTFTIHDVTKDRLGADVDVYIVYGDDITYGNKLKSSPDGIFEFKYLRKGVYTVYAYSKDPSPDGKVAVKIKAEITGKKQTVDAGMLTIKD
ncbi:MAG: hypothetical protein V4608_17090 [Bacteroidota bacterium]